jgi:putative addiction module component (TIGR02574 family)
LIQGLETGAETMSAIVEQLKPTIAALSVAERDELLEYLISLRDGDEPELSDEEWEEAWSEEIQRRMDDVAAGRSKMIPAEEVFREANELLKQHKQR